MSSGERSAVRVCACVRVCARMRAPDARASVVDATGTKRGRADDQQSPVQWEWVDMSDMPKLDYDGMRKYITKTTVKVEQAAQALHGAGVAVEQAAQASHGAGGVGNAGGNGEGGAGNPSLSDSVVGGSGPDDPPLLCGLPPPPLGSLS